MEKILWEVQFTSLPKIKKYCKKCGVKSDFVSSELFRVNANKQSVDIWMIYKCQDCKTTWKQAIYSRINPKDISPDMLERFHTNDKALAREYLMNVSDSSFKGCDIIVPDYQIMGSEIEGFDNCEHEIHVVSAYEFNIKISSIIKEKLNITNSRLEKLISQNKIACNSNKNIKKCRLQKEQIIKITI